jgi:erythronate-4-phosphate dehydrogenase
MKVVCATSVLRGEQAFSGLGEVLCLPEAEITRDHLRDADVLITRSKVRINEALLAGTPVRFVGCAVAGTDHVDEAYLQSADIAFAYAPGCNANSVAEYVLTALLLEAERHNLALNAEWTLGVIGVGHIGTRVVEKAYDLGVKVLMNDPPRLAEHGPINGDFSELDVLLSKSDAVTLHVPLTSAGSHATRGMVNHRFFGAMKPGTLFLNTSRGEVMDGEAVRSALKCGMLLQAVLDVWEHEPAIDADLLQRVDIGTPHIAGYSVEGRLNGTRMVYEQLCEWLEEKPVWPQVGEPDISLPEIEIDAAGRLEQDVITELAQRAYPLMQDDQRLRQGATVDAAAMSRHFNKCRQTYPPRHEFAAHRVVLRNAAESLRTSVWELGFQVSE